MKLYHTLALTLALWIAAITAQQPNCNNILVQISPYAGWSSQLFFLPTPAVTPPNNICGYLAGQESCCDSAFFSQMEAAWQQIRQEMAYLQDGLNSIDDLRESMKNEVLYNWEESIKDAPISDQEKNELKQKLEKILDALGNFISDGTPKFAACVEGMLEYAVGFTCLACRDVGYVEELSSTEALLHYSHSVCDTIGGPCGSLITLYFNFFNQLKDALSDLCEAIPDADADCIDQDWNITLPCAGDDACKQYICNNLLDGYGIANAFTNLFNSGDENVKRSSLRKVLGPAATATAKKIFAKFGTLEKRKADLRQFLQQLSVVYADDGFDATKVGRDSSLDTSAPFSGVGQLTSWLHWF